MDSADFFSFIKLWLKASQPAGHSTERRIKKPSGFQHFGLKNMHRYRFCTLSKVGMKPTVIIFKCALAPNLSRKKLQLSFDVSNAFKSTIVSRSDFSILESFYKNKDFSPKSFERAGSI